MLEHRLIHQGGIPIGYFDKDTAVMDSDFWAGETARNLAYRGEKMRFEPGLAQKLKTEEGKKPLPRKVRVHQIKPQAAPDKKFICYALLYQRFGGISPEDYQVVFDGQPDTDDLNRLYELFNAETLPQGYTGHRLSVSDVVELYDRNGSEFWYLDEEGFVPVMMG